MLKKTIKKILFRCDASLQIGSGHVMRCLTLANKLRELGAECRFACREHEGNLLKKIRQEGFDTIVLPLDGSIDVKRRFVDKSLVHGDWLGTDWLTDVQQTIEGLRDYSPDWLVVDHYALDARWESALRQTVRQIMVIDDMFDRHHDADLLLNQNILPGAMASYAGLVPKRCRLLLGPSYALLNASYRELRNRVPPRKGKIERVLVYFGGIDAPNLTGRSLEALMALGCGKLGIDVVLPVAGPHSDSVREVAGRLEGACIHETLPSLAQLMATADLAIGAAGTTSWERLCLGLPTLVVSLSENQRLIAQALQISQLALWLGHCDDVSVEHLTEALRPLLQEGLPQDWSLRCRSAVDGSGVDRVVAQMALCTDNCLTARPATIDDEIFVDDWVEALYVSNIEGRRYGRMLRTLGDDCLYVVEAETGIVVGAVLATCREGIWHLLSEVAPAAVGICNSDQMEKTALARMRSDNTGLLLLAPVTSPKSGSLRIALCSDQSSWINEFIPPLLIQWRASGHTVAWAHDAALLPESHVCFYLSYSRIVGETLRSRHGNNLVVHESDLPSGRGWSPLTWQVLQGAQEIVVTLFEAADAVDAGVIYCQTVINLRGDELVDDLRRQQAAATFSLCSEFVTGYPTVLQQARQQCGAPSYFPRRTPEDSRINLDLPLRDQFNLLRVCDNTRYPAWFEHAGARYTLSISRVEQDSNAD